MQAHNRINSQYRGPMSQLLAAAPFTEADYEMISSAVLETARGRWFLAEHARRNRNADTLLVLEAIDKLERSMAQRTTSAETERIRVDLVEMMDAIARTKAEVAAIKPAGNGGQIKEASNELDSIVATTERATSDILAGTEHFQEIGHTLREQGVNSAVCDLIDTNAADIFAACTFQDLTGQRIRKVIEVLRFLEERIDAMIGIWPDDEGGESAAAEPAARIPRIERREQSEEYHRQETVDEIINGTRAQDVTWHDAPLRKVDTAAGHGGDDLDDLLVFENAPPMQAAPDSVPAATRTQERHPDLAELVMPAEKGPAAASELQLEALAQAWPAEEPQPAPQAIPDPLPADMWPQEPHPELAEFAMPAEEESVVASETQPEASAQAQPGEEPKAAPQTEPEAMKHPGASSGLASLTLTERMALFS